jgi:hypothetical protein
MDEPAGVYYKEAAEEPNDWRVSFSLPPYDEQLLSS